MPCELLLERLAWALRHAKEVVQRGSWTLRASAMALERVIHVRSAGAGTQRARRGQPAAHLSGESQPRSRSRQHGSLALRDFLPCLRDFLGAEGKITSLLTSKIRLRSITMLPKHPT